MGRSPSAACPARHAVGLPLNSHVRPHTYTPMLHPNQFRVNEAWIIFKLNDAPLSTKTDGDFHLLALMDAASCFILGTTTLPVASAELSPMESRRLLKQGRSHKNQLPNKLLIPDGLPTSNIATEAEHQGITIVHVSPADLEAHVGEARAAFRERFGGESMQ
jgi:hypothetical protein